MRILLIQASLSVCGAIRCNASGIVWRRKRKSWVFLRAAHVPQAAVRWWNRGIDSENRGSFSRSICGLSPSKKWRAPMRFRIYIVSATVAVSLALSGCGGHGVEVATTSGGIVSGGSGGTGSGTTSGGTTSGGTTSGGTTSGGTTSGGTGSGGTGGGSGGSGGSGGGSGGSGGLAPGPPGSGIPARTGALPSGEASLEAPVQGVVNGGEDRAIVGARV
jgi:hypothetical protein